MSEAPIETIPHSAREKLLKERYIMAIADQGDLLDGLGQKLLVIVMSVAGLYATALRLLPEKEAAAISLAWLLVTFGYWLLAMGCILYGIFPRKWPVNPHIMRRDPACQSGELGIEDFFTHSANHKRRWLLGAIGLFFAGVLTAAFTIF